MRLPRKKRGIPPLMLTSLLDMFTIILIFLIVSFEAENYDFRLNPDLTLPESTARSIFRPAVNLAVTRDAVLVEQQPVLPLTEGRARPTDYDLGHMPELVEHLRALYAERSAQATERSAEALPDDDEDDPTIVVLQADKDMDYRTLYLVMRSASQAGFSRHRLAVMKR